MNFITQIHTIQKTKEKSVPCIDNKMFSNATEKKIEKMKADYIIYELILL